MARLETLVERLGKTMLLQIGGVHSDFLALARKWREEGSSGVDLGTCLTH